MPPEKKIPFQLQRGDQNDTLQVVGQEPLFLEKPTRAFKADWDLTYLDQEMLSSGLEELRYRDNKTPFFSLATQITFLFPSDEIDLTNKERYELTIPSNDIEETVTKALAGKVLFPDYYPFFDVDTQEAADQLVRMRSEAEYEYYRHPLNETLFKLKLLDPDSVTPDHFASENASYLGTWEKDLNEWKERGFSLRETEQAAWTRVIDPENFSQIPQHPYIWDATKRHIRTLREGGVFFRPDGWERYSPAEKVAQHAVNMLFISAEEIGVTKEKIEITP